MNRPEKIVSKVTGFIEPIFTDTLPDGKKLNGITEEDMAMISAGYACGECLATFKDVTLWCPVCNQSTNVITMPTPQLWLDHLHEREHPTEHNQPATFDEAMTRKIETEGR